MTPQNFLLTVLMCSVFLSPSVPGPAAAYPIAGIAPDRRPEGAPEIQQVQKGKGWYAKALTGITTPYPYSLRFLEDQGNWYTPFIIPGMHGRYDIRGWHQE